MQSVINNNNNIIENLSAKSINRSLTYSISSVAQKYEDLILYKEK